MLSIANKDAKVIVQGAIGVEGRFHTEKMREYGTNVIAGIDPAASVTELDGLPIYRKISDVIKNHGSFDISVIFVPAPFVLDAVLEVANYGVKLVVLITEGVALNDAIQVKNILNARGINLIGPNCPGLIVPGQIKLGILPGHICQEGPVAIISKSGTLTYEVIAELCNSNAGQSACIGIGGDPVIGTDFVDLLKYFNTDDKTKAVIIIGEIGGNAELLAADYIKEHFTKPVAAFIAGSCAPPEKKMGHAGAIVSSSGESAQEKIAYLKAKGIKMAEIPSDLGPLAEEMLKNI